MSSAQEAPTEPEKSRTPSTGKYSRIFPERLPKRRLSDPVRYDACKWSYSSPDMLVQAPPFKARCQREASTSPPLSRNNSVIDWLALPPEIWYHILRMLKEDDLVTMGKCCHALELFAKSDYVWRDLFTSTYGLQEMPPVMAKPKCTWEENFFRLRNAVHVRQPDQTTRGPATRVKVAATLSEAVGILRQGSFFASHACAAPSDRLVIVHPGVHAGAVFTTPATVVGAGTHGEVVISSSDSSALCLVEGSGQSTFKDIVFETISTGEDDALTLWK